MYRAYMEIKQHIFDKFVSVAKKIIDEKKMKIEHIFFTGHSLGGALSNFAAYNFIHRKRHYNHQKVKDAEAKYFEIKKVSLVTFGAPRVGNKAFAAYMKGLLDSSELSRNYRVIYGQDPIPNLPPKQIEEFNVADLVTKSLIPSFILEHFKADKTNFLEFEHAGTEIRFSKDTITDEIKKKDETMKAAFAKITPVRGQKNVDTCLNEAKYWDIIKDLGNAGDHSYYKFIDGKKLWDFFKSTEGKKPSASQ
jgi:hypothetical protein